MAKISLKSLTSLCRRVATSIEAGIDDKRIWEVEIQNAGPLARAPYQTVLRQISAGESWADSLRSTDGFFPAMVCEMVEAGERSGRLDAVFAQLADHTDNLIRLRRTFIAGVWWPLFELFAAICIVGALILALGVVAGMTGGEPVDFFGFGMGTTGNFILYCLMITFAAAAIGIPIMAITKGWLGSAPIRVAHRLPLIGPTIECIALSRMAWSLAMSIDAGMDAIKSLTLSMRATQNPLYMEQIDKVNKRLTQGQEMHVALQSTGVFPDSFLTTLENGELTGQVTESMDRLSGEYRSKAETLFRTIAMLGGLLVMAFVGALIIVLIFFLFTRFILGPINDAAGL